MTFPDRVEYDNLQISNKVYWVGFLTQHALHGGCPVIEGDKWVATKWIRDKQFGVL